MRKRDQSEHTTKTRRAERRAERRAQREAKHQEHDQDSLGGVALPALPPLPEQPAGALAAPKRAPKEAVKLPDLVAPIPKAVVDTAPRPAPPPAGLPSFRESAAAAPWDVAINRVLAQVEADQAQQLASAMAQAAGNRAVAGVGKLMQRDMSSHSFGAASVLLMLGSETLQVADGVAGGESLWDELRTVTGVSDIQEAVARSAYTDNPLELLAELAGLSGGISKVLDHVSAGLFAASLGCMLFPATVSCVVPLHAAATASGLLAGSLGTVEDLSLSAQTALAHQLWATYGRTPEEQLLLLQARMGGVSAALKFGPGFSPATEQLEHAPIGELAEQLAGPATGSFVGMMADILGQPVELPDLGLPAAVDHFAYQHALHAAMSAALLLQSEQSGSDQQGRERASETLAEWEAYLLRAAEREPGAAYARKATADAVTVEQASTGAAAKAVELASSVTSVVGTARSLIGVIDTVLDVLPAWAYELGETLGGFRDRLATLVDLADWAATFDPDPGNSEVWASIGATASAAAADQRTRLGSLSGTLAELRQQNAAAADESGAQHQALRARAEERQRLAAKARDQHGAALEEAQSWAASVPDE